MLWIQIVLVVYLCLYVVKVIQGPSIWNRLLGMNLITTKIILMVVVFASMLNTAYFLDFAIIYAVCGFIGTIFLANFMSDRVIADKDENMKEKPKSWRGRIVKHISRRKSKRDSMRNKGAE